MNEPLISIVIPVYNIEKYLQRCVDSVIGQTYKNIEVILVNDGSTDSCNEICSELKKVDKRIRVINKKNGGLSSARNAGMKEALGEYILFVDGDDTIDGNMCQEMIKTAINNKVDIVMCDYIRIDSKDKIEEYSEDIREGLYLKKDIKEEIFNKLIMRECIDYGPFLSVWVFLYKLDFLKRNNIEFDSKIRWSEDNIFSAIVGYNAESFYYMKGKYFYNYYRNDNSITTTYKKQAWEVYLLMNKKIKYYFENKKDYNFSRQIELHMLYYTLNCIGNANRFEKNFKEKYKQIKMIVNTNELIDTMKEFDINQENYKLKIILYLIKYRLSFILTVFLNFRYPKK